MTGLQHYEAGQSFLERSVEAATEYADWPASSAYALIAQAHFAAALVAATARQPTRTQADAADWNVVING